MRNKFLESSFYVLFSNALRLISKFLVGVVAAKILGPTNFGFYNLIDLVGKYGPLSTLGVPSGTSREIPLSLGRGSERRASELNDTGFTGLLITTGVAAVLIICGSALFFSGLSLFAISMASLGLFVNAVYEYHIVYLYSYSQFRRASNVISIYSVFLLLLTVSLVLLFDIWGQFFAIFIVPLATILFVYSRKIHRFSISFDIPLYFHIIKIGLPMLVIGIGYTFLITIDRILVVKLYDITSLGYYGLAIMVFVFSQQVPAAITQVIYPKLNLMFGQSDRIDKLGEIAILPSVLLSIGMPPLIAVFMYSLPFIVTTFLPAYSNGILSAELIIIPISVFGINILNTIFKIGPIISALIVSIVVKILAAYMFYKFSLGLEGIAIASSVALLLYTVIVTVLSLLYMSKSKTYIIRYSMLYIAVPVLLVTIFFLFINGYIHNPGFLFPPILFYLFIAYRLFRHHFDWNALLIDLG